MSYLAGNAKQLGEDGSISYQRSRVFFHTIFFVFGISFAFFILGMSFTALGTFFRSNQYWFTRIGGILIIVLGLIQLGILDFKFLQRERRLRLNFLNRKMNPLVAFFMGFTFSFAWTPCVGPALSSVLIMASGTGSNLMGNLLVAIYTIGFTLPFLLLGLFTTQVLNFLKSHQKLLKYAVKVGGALLILIGFMTFTGWMNSFSKYLNSFTVPSVEEADEQNNNRKNTSDSNDANSENSDTNDPTDSNRDDYNANQENKTNNSNQDPTDNTGENEGNQDADPENTSSHNFDSEDKTEADDQEEEAKKVPAIDFTLVDQYGNEHTLSDYKGKVVFLNFWATWCPPCQREMPDIEELYQEFNQNKDDIVILGVANPSSEEFPYNQDVSQEEIIEFLEENEYSFPTVFDVTGEVFANYYVYSFPTTFFIDKEGNILGYAPGMMTKDMMLNGLQHTLEATE